MGGGGYRSIRQKSFDNVFFIFSPHLILQKSNGYFQRKLSFLRFRRGSDFFQVGGGGGGPIAYSL